MYIVGETITGDNRAAWAISGKTRGMLSIESGKVKETQVDLMPLFQGSLTAILRVTV